MRKEGAFDAMVLTPGAFESDVEAPPGVIAL